jgi:hypothetical protein
MEKLQSKKVRSGCYDLFFKDVAVAEIQDLHQDEYDEKAAKHSRWCAKGMNNERHFVAGTYSSVEYSLQALWQEDPIHFLRTFGQFGYCMTGHRSGLYTPGMPAKDADIDEHYAALCAYKNQEEAEMAIVRAEMLAREKNQ